MAARCGRFLNLTALLGVGVSSMVVAHCGGYQLAAFAGWGTGGPGASVGSTVDALHAHHLHHGQSVDALASGSAGVHAGHDHLLPMASSAFLIAVVACLGALIALRHRRRLTAPRFRSLLAVQLAGFAVLELVDRLPSGAGLAETLTDRRVMLGLLLQPVVAAAVRWFCRHTIAAVEALLAPISARATGLPTGLWVPVERRVRPLCLHTITRAPRGPPNGAFVPT